MRHVLVLLLLAGCTASASLHVSTSPGDASASTSVSTRPPSVKIVRHGDRLDYESAEIEFETGSSALTGEGTTEILDRFAAVLERYPELKIRIEGHTDSRGSTKSNQILSEARAEAIKTALVQRGIAADRLATRGFGETRPERVEPPECRNRSEETVDPDDLPRCREIWTANRRAGFIVTEGADSLPAEGSDLGETDAKHVPEDSSAERRPDWALRLFGGYSLFFDGDDYHGGHLGVALHASQRFGARRRGYIGGGPRLHFRGLRAVKQDWDVLWDVGLHQFGPEGNLLIGGGNDKIVGLFSLRLGLGLSAVHDGGAKYRFGTWVFGGPTLLAKLHERWSLGGHLDFGMMSSGLVVGFAAEFGLNVAWHFGRGRRAGI